MSVAAAALKIAREWVFTNGIAILSWDPVARIHHERPIPAGLSPRLALASVRKEVADDLVRSVSRDGRSVVFGSRLAGPGPAIRGWWATTPAGLNLYLGATASSMFGG